MDLDRALERGKARCQGEDLQLDECDLIATTYVELRSHRLIVPVLQQLKAELAPDLTFHSYDHTEEVLFDAILFAVTDGRSARETELLAIAAAFHDVGFLQARKKNEGIAAPIAMRAMREDGNYSDEEIELVGQMILDTQLRQCDDGFFRQVPSTDLSRYLLDADMSNLGRPDFFHKCELHRREVDFSMEQFFVTTLKLLEGHHWHTEAAKKLREYQKCRNQDLMQKRWSAQCASTPCTTHAGRSISNERLAQLARLPAQLNTSWGYRAVVYHVLDFLVDTTQAEAATVFLREEGTEEVTFLGVEGGKRESLEGVKMPAGKGIVGWVIQHAESTKVDDVSKDPRFFGDIDKENNFKTRNLLCAPLVVRQQVIGAVQVLNKMGSAVFDDEDLDFVQEVAALVAMAIDNARAYEQLEAKNQLLQELDKRKNEFLSVLSHEFRTPLAVIQTAGDLLETIVGDGDEKVVRVNDMIKRGISRMTNVFLELRNLTYVSGKGISVKKSPFELAELCDQVKMTYLDAAFERGITLGVEGAEEVPPILGDRSLLLTALINLVSNAIKFTDNDGTVTISARKTAGFVEISVTDTGVGISEEHLHSIFETFYEVGEVEEHSTSRTGFKGGGLGIGLTAAKAIVEAHGSTLEIESELGKGSRFFFRVQPEE